MGPWSLITPGVVMMGITPIQQVLTWHWSRSEVLLGIMSFISDNEMVITNPVLQMRKWRREVGGSLLRFVQMSWDYISFRTALCSTILSHTFMIYEWTHYNTGEYN